jgi:hypothetical protein
MEPAMKKFTLFLLTSCVIIAAETHITGDISGMQFDASGNPYIVEQDIIIPEAKKVVIKEGCVLLFKAFTGLNVQGHLVVQGKQGKPVVFSSINDGDYMQNSDQLPNPFDWNGILLSRESGTVSFSYFNLNYSVYGIKSQNPNIQINNGMFKQNGQFHFTINDKIQYVQDNLAYSYNAATDNQGQTVTPSSGSNSKKNVVTKKRKIFRYTSLGTGSAFALSTIGLGMASYIIYNNALNDHNNNVITKDYKDIDNKYTNFKRATIGSAVLMTAGFVCFGLSFNF